MDMNEDAGGLMMVVIGIGIAIFALLIMTSRLPTCDDGFALVRGVSGYVCVQGHEPKK